MSCCMRGFTNGSFEAMGRLDETKKNRISCINSLLKLKPDLNLTDSLKNTALHWAAY